MNYRGSWGEVWCILLEMFLENFEDILVIYDIKFVIKWKYSNDFIFMNNEMNMVLCVFWGSKG